MTHQSPLPPFRGFPAPRSNVTYVPNQYFDVVLPYSSRGVVRLVSYMIRKTLGWCDEEGNPRETEILIPYVDLEAHAGINRDMIRQAIEEATAANFIRCVRAARPKTKGQAAVSGLYELKWDDHGDYTTDPSRFQGFYSRSGHRTYIPNAFLDRLVPNEPLSVIRVVGAVIRFSIGFENRFGHRRQKIALSYRQLHRRTRIASPRSLAQAVQTSLERNYIRRLQAGFFDLSAANLSKAAVYALKWEDSEPDELFDYRVADDRSEKDSRPSVGKVKPGRLQNRSEKDSRVGRKSEAVDRSEKDSTKTIKPRNETSEIKQQQRSAAAVEVLETLKGLGFRATDAAHLADTHIPERIRQQINWLERRNPSKNALGMLRRAIEENWPEPPQVECLSADISEGSVFAAHFYAERAGNRETPTAPIPPHEAAIGKQYVDRLTAEGFLGEEAEATAQLGREFGRLVAERHPSNRSPLALTLALRLYGDDFFVRLKGRLRQATETAKFQAEEGHYDQYQDAWLEYVRMEEQRIRTEQPEAAAAFDAEHEARRQRLSQSREPWDQHALDRHDREANRLQEFASHFREEVLDFWSWDEKLNPSGLAKVSL